MDASTQTEPMVPFPDYCERDGPAPSRFSTIFEVTEESSDDTTCHTEVEGYTQGPAPITSDFKSTLLRGEEDDPANGETLKTVDTSFTPPTADTAASSQSAKMTEDDGLPQSYSNAPGNLLQEVIAEARSKNSISTMLKLLDANGKVTVSDATSGKWEVHAIIEDTSLLEEVDKSTADKISMMISWADTALAQKAKLGDLSTDIHPADRSGPMIVLTDPPRGRPGLRCDTGPSVPVSTTPTTPSWLTARDALSRPVSPAVRSGASTPTSPGSPIRIIKEKLWRLSGASLSESTSSALSRLRERSPPKSLARALQEASGVAASVGHPVASTASTSPERHGDRRNSYLGRLGAVRGRRSSMT